MISKCMFLILVIGILSISFIAAPASVGSYSGSWDAVDAGGTKLGKVMIYYPELS